MNIGNTIKQYRKLKKIQQNDLAEKSGISQTYMSQIENGSRVASIETLQKVCNVLDIPFSIMSFLSLDLESISPNKREEYSRIQPKIKAMVDKIFI